MPKILNASRAKVMLKAGLILILLFSMIENPPHYLGLLLALIAWIRLMYEKENRIKYILNIPFVRAILVLLVISFLPVFYAEYTHYVIRKWSRVLQALFTYLFFYELLIQEENLMRYTNYLLAGAIGVGIHGLIDYWVRNPRRADAFMGPNTRAIYFLLVLFIPLAYVFLKELNMKRRLLYGFSSIIVFFNIVLTKTRGAWMALAAGLVFFSFIKGKKLLALLMILFMIAAPFLSENIAERGRTILDFEDTRIEEGWPQAIDMLTDHNIFLGVGSGNYRALAQNEYDISGGMRRHTHNLFLQFTVDLGIMGLIYIIAFTIYLFSQMKKAYEKFFGSDSFEEAYIIAFLTVIISFYVHTLTHLSIHNRSTAAIAMFLLAGFSYCLQEKEEPTSTGMQN